MEKLETGSLEGMKDFGKYFWGSMTPDQSLIDLKKLTIDDHPAKLIELMRHGLRFCRKGDKEFRKKFGKTVEAVVLPYIENKEMKPNEMNHLLQLVCRYLIRSEDCENPPFSISNLDFDLTQDTHKPICGEPPQHCTENDNSDNFLKFLIKQKNEKQPGIKLYFHRFSSKLEKGFVVWIPCQSNLEVDSLAEKIRLFGV